MRSVLIVILLPVSDLLSRFIQRREKRLIEAFVSEAAIEAFDEGILCWLCGRDIMPINFRFLAPLQNRGAGHFVEKVAFRFGS